MNFLFKLIDVSNIKRISFRNDINGLRAIAVLVVVFYHAEIEIFKGGWIGVDIFFVISGYLISNIIISELNKEEFSFKNFYLKRIYRIIPAFFSTLLLTIPFACLFLTVKAMEEFTNSLFASLFYYANYHFMNVDFYAAESAKLMPLLHTWSLAIEEQYYILFPIFGFLFYRYIKKYFTFVIGFITLISLYLNTLTQSTDKFYRLEFRIWELLLGVLVMIVSSNYKIKHLEKIGIPLMLFPIFYFGDNWINDIEPKLIALTGVSFIIFSNTKSSILTKFLSFKIISTIGLSSYSIYLIHQPLFAFFRVIILNINLIWIRYTGAKLNSSIDILNFAIFETNNLSDITYKIIDLLLILLTIGIGFVSYKFIEVPFLKFNYAKKYLLIFFIILSAFSFIKPSPFLGKNNPRGLTENVFSEYECWNNHRLDENNFRVPENCFINNNSNKDLIILGDSSSVSISKNLMKKNIFNNYNIYFISVGDDNFFKNFKHELNCSNCFSTWIKEKSPTIIFSIELHRYIEPNGIYFTEGYSNQMIKNFLENIHFLSLASENLFILESFPTIPLTINNPLDIVNLDKVDGRKEVNEIYIPYSIWKQNTKFTNKTYSLLQNNFDLKIVRTNDLFCSDQQNKCLIYSNDILLYQDQVHLSLYGGELITNRIGLFLEY